MEIIKTQIGLEIREYSGIWRALNNQELFLLDTMQEKISLNPSLLFSYVNSPVRGYLQFKIEYLEKQFGLDLMNLEYHCGVDVNFFDAVISYLESSKGYLK